MYGKSNMHKAIAIAIYSSANFETTQMSNNGVIDNL